MRVAAAIACAHLVLTIAGTARADRPRIVLLADRADDPLALMLAADGQLAGFAIVVVTGAFDGVTPAELSRQARSARAIAVVRVAVDADGAEILIADRVTDKVVVREVPAASVRGAAGEQVLALRVIELLRGSLVELAVRSRSRDDAPPPPAVVALASPSALPRTDRYVLRAGFSTAIGGGGLSPAYLASTGIGAFVGTRAVLTLDAAVSVASARLDEPAAAGELAPLLLMVTASRDLLRRERSVRATVGIGAAWIGLRASGHPQPGTPGTAASETSMAGAPVASAELGWAFAQRVELGVAASVGVALPAPVLRVRGDAVARWGTPFVLIGVRVALRAL